MCLDFDVVRSFVFFCVETRMVVWMTGHVESVYVEGCGGSTSDVCPVSWMWNEVDGTENGVLPKMTADVEEKVGPVAADWMLVQHRPLEVRSVLSPQAFLVVPS